MKRALLSSFLFSFLFILAANGAFAQSININKPAASDPDLVVGTDRLIEFGSSGVDNVKIEYSTDNGVTWNIISNSFSTLDPRYTWKVPGVVNAKSSVSDNCLIKISDVLAPATSAVSEKLKIVKPAKPALTAPADGAKIIGLSDQLTWPDVTSATLYTILVATDAAFTLNVTTKTSATASLAIPNASNNTKYYWKVKALVSGIETDFSDARNFTTKLKTSVLALPLDLAKGVSKSVMLSWLSTEGATKYQLKYSQNSDMTGSVTVNNIIGLTATVILANETQYYWQVKALNDDGNEGDFSGVRSFTTVHVAPGLTTPANGTASLNFLKVAYSWAAIAGAANYDLQVSTSAGFESANTTTYNYIPSNSYTPQAYLAFGTTYYWRVRVKKEIYYSEYSDPYSFTTGTPKTGIEDVNASVKFDHANGQISKIAFLKGSGKQLLDTLVNSINRTGLGRISGETNTKLASWTEAAGSCVYNYENPVYGAKTFTVKWDADSITVNIKMDLLASKSATVSAAWQPGEDNGPLHDYVMYADENNKFSKTNLTYPSVTKTVSGANALLTVMNDDRNSEYFGFKSAAAVQTKIEDGNGLLNISHIYPASASAQSLSLRFAVQKSRSSFFTWTARKYVLVSYPQGGEKLLDKTSQKIKWETFGTAGNVSINFSSDNGGNYSSLVLTSAADDDSESVTLPNGLTPPANNCLIKVTANGTSGVSNQFSIVNGASTKIYIDKDLTASATSEVNIPVKIAPAAGAQIHAFDIKLEYDKNSLELKKYTPANPGLNNWTADVTSNLSSGSLQIGGFNNGGSAVSASGTLVTLTFLVKEAARVGTELSLKINNTSVSIADVNAKNLDVIGEDGKLTVYSRIWGNLRYIMSKKPIIGSNFVILKISEQAIADSVSSAGKNGTFDFANIKPGSIAEIAPDTSKGSADVMAAAVTSVDARIAFDGREGGSKPISDLQKIAADVNGDGLVNSIDAYAILKFSTKALTPKVFKLPYMIFVDSSFTLTSASWSQAPREITYSPLDGVKAKQTFWGMIRGDVNGDYSLPDDIFAKLAVSKVSSDPAALTYSIPADLRVKPDDTLYIPLNINLNSKAVGAFNASIVVDKSLLEYTGQYLAGQAVPADKGWVFSTYFENSGKLNIAATDLSGALDPITKNGTIAVFKFVVNKNAHLGDTSHIGLSGISVSDNNLAKLNYNIQEGRVIISDVTSVSEKAEVKEYSLSQNYPNPFNPSTTIEYALPKESKVQIDIYNSIGQKVASLFNGVQSSGYHKTEWNASRVSSGIYFYSINARSLSDGKDFKSVRKMILLK